MAGKFGFLVFVVFAAFSCSFAANPNNRPIIGILDQPTGGDFLPHGSRYISASYVKWVESAGGRAVPVRFDQEESDLRYLFESLNGLIFTGGDIENFTHNAYFETLKLLYSWVLDANAKGDYFPLWGTCQGFQMLAMITANDTKVVTQYAFDSENLPLPLTFTSAAAKSRLYGSLSPELFKALATQNLTMNLHHDGVYPQVFQTNQKLSAFYNLLSTNVDRKGSPFASSFEGKNVPVYGVQYHPERNQFEWDLPESLDHSGIAMQVMQGLANFLVDEARKSQHHFSTVKEETRALIYNYPPTYTGNFPDTYPEQQTYFFK